MKIYTYPNPILRATSEPVDNIDEDIRRLIDGMAETMYAAPGVGLAANRDHPGNPQTQPLGQKVSTFTSAAVKKRYILSICRGRRWKS